MSESIEEDTEYFYPYCISYAWYAMIGTFMTFSIGYISSLISCQDPKIDPNLLISPLRNQILRQETESIISNGGKYVEKVKSQELLPIVDVPDKK